MGTSPSPFVVPLNAGFSAPGALAQEAMVLKSADVHPVGYPTVAAVESFGKKLSDATSGRLERSRHASHSP